MKKFCLIGMCYLFFVCVAHAKSVTLFIGDGMGPVYITATRLYLKTQHKKLHLDTFSHVAIVQTYSASSIVTDSAAAGTAISSGVKTRNGVIGQDATAVKGKKNGKNIYSIADFAKKRGMSVGIITTMRVTHATPAAFYAHVNTRDDEKTISQQLIKSHFDVFLGGGLKYFDSKKLALLKKQGFSIVTTEDELKKIDFRKTKKLFGAFASSHLAYEYDRVRKHLKEPSLTELTLAAYRVLKKNPRGYFLMVEGGRIDYAGHANDAKRAIMGTAALDHAIWAYQKKTNPKNTLILVTADHETGGLVINGYPDLDVPLFGMVKEDGKMLQYPVLSWSTGPGFGVHANKQGLWLKKQPSQFYRKYAAHTGADVYLYGWGSGSYRVKGTIENTDIFKIMKAALLRK